MEFRKMLRIMIRTSGGAKSERGKSLVRDILDLCKSEGIIGAVVIQCLHGYGDRDYQPSILRGIHELPQVIEIVDEPAVIREFLPKLKNLVGSQGLITLEEVLTF